MQTQQPHRPGPLHQTNKAHKGGRKSSTTSQLKAKSLGKPLGKSLSKLKRTERLNQAHQARKLHHEKLIDEKRKIKTEIIPPPIVGILDLYENSSSEFINQIESIDDESISIQRLNDRVAYILSSRLKLRFQMIALDSDNFDETLDTVKNVDILLLVHRPNLEEEYDYTNTLLYRSIYVHCLPTVVHVIDGRQKIEGSIDDKLLTSAKRILRQNIKDDKVHSVERDSDYQQLIHLLGNCKKVVSQFQDTRPAVIGDRVDIIDSSLAISGYVRKNVLSANDLVHLVGIGEYQIKKIDILPDPHSQRGHDRPLDEIVQEIRPDPMRQETLEQENDIDLMDVDLQCEDQKKSYDNLDEMPARTRYARYRALTSFRTSTWDPEENLPPDYNRIVRFKDFHLSKKRILDDRSKDGANPGLYVRVHLDGVPEKIMNYIVANRAEVVPPMIGLLKYERKMTVMNFLIKRVPDFESDEPIKSKDELIFYVGFRKFKARPLFTIHSASAKFKYERYLEDDATMVATVFAPVTFPPAPVLVFRQNSRGVKEVVASGSVLDSNPNRMIIKRIRLSGNPYKIHSRSVVVRNMFENSEDVRYFKPVELVTKHKRRGHITEALGTHGYMKCLFDRKIKSDDCIFMNLYKRVFPKWTYSPLLMDS